MPWLEYKFACKACGKLCVKRRHTSNPPVYCSKACSLSDGRAVVDDVKRFWSKTVPQGACLVWVGELDKDGYGKYATGPAAKRRKFTAHRWIYLQVLGSVAPGKVLMHSCDTPACVSLQHLTTGTQSQNVRDAVAKGRALRGGKNPNTSLSEEVVAQIKSALRAGEPRTAVATRFGVSKAVIHQIAKGQTWRHVS